MRIRTLGRDDLDDAFGLSRQAGWNQLRPDWRRLLDLSPEGCFGGWIDGELVATATAITYDGEASWIGMVLVDEDHRRRGYGSEAFERALAAALEHDPAVVGLDATDLGRSLYRDAGFADAAPIARWCGELEPVAPPTAVDELAPGRSAVHDFDRRACGVDRSALLDHLLSEAGTRGFVREVDGAVRGYAILRPGRNHRQLGPLVAERREDAASLFGAAADRLDGDTVVVDAVRTDDADALLSAAGLSATRELSRMTRGRADRTLWADALWAAGGFELG